MLPTRNIGCILRTKTLKARRQKLYYVNIKHEEDTEAG